MAELDKMGSAAALAGADALLDVVNRMPVKGVRG